MVRSQPAVDLRPFLAALGTAVIGCGLLAAAIAWDWLGPNVGRGAQFCEEMGEGLFAQPANTLSNLGFVVAGLAIGWQSRHGDVLPRLPGVAAGYGCVVVLLGPASGAMHATGTAWGGHLDMLSMYLVAGFAAACAVTRWFDAGPRTFWTLFAAFVLGCELVAAVWRGSVPVVEFSGNVAFAALLLTAAVVEVRLWVRGHPARARLGWGVAAIGSMVVAFVIWNLAKGPWCDPHSWLQGHGVWHLLCALAAWCLFALYRSERFTGASSTASDGVR